MQISWQAVGSMHVYAGKTDGYMHAVQAAHPQNVSIPHDPVAAVLVLQVMHDLLPQRLGHLACFQHSLNQRASMGHISLPLCSLSTSPTSIHL